MDKTDTDSNGYKPFRPNMRISIWLTTAVVITLILILALTVNYAREKDIVEQFSRQQMAIARGAATGIEDFISSAEKSMIILSKLPFVKGVMPETTRQSLQMIYDNLKGQAEYIAIENKDGVTTNTYPPSIFEKITGSPDESGFKSHAYFREIKKTGNPYISDLLLEWDEEYNDVKNRFRPIIIAVPKYDSESRFSGAVLVVLSLSTIVDRYLISENETSCAWIMDNSGAILVHPDQSRLVGIAGKDLGALECAKTHGGISLKDALMKGKEGYGEYMLPVMGGGTKKSIVAYAPINLHSGRWFIAVATPYNETVLLARKGFVNIIFGTLGLIIVVIIAGISIAYSGAKQLRLKEELKRLREREEWQEKLLKEHKTTEGVIEGSPIPTFVLNREHRVILWNRACSELTGFGAGDMIGTDQQYVPFYKTKRPTIADIIIDYDIDALEKYYGTKNVQKSTTVKGAYEAMDYIENLGGKNRHIYFLAAPIYDESGKVIAAIETIQDVTSQREMDIRLEEYAETLQNELTENINLRGEIENLFNYLQPILDSLPEKIFDINSEGIINYVSRDMKKNGGITSQKFGGKHFADFVDEENRQFVLDRWKDAKEGIFTPYEMTVTAKDGSRRNLLITPRPVKGTDRYILVQRDITEFKALERKFYESQKLAAIGQLSAGIAHEVRNPLSSIKMSLQILEKRMKPEGNDSKRFQIAGREVGHLEKLVNDILFYARPSNPIKKPSDIEKIIGHALAMAEKAVSDKHIRVKTALAKDLPSLDVDPAMLEQAFLNIYHNAIDAMADGGKLSISARQTNGRVFVEVKDNGCGIAVEDMPHIFNPFFTRKKYGTGLGLTQIKKIVDLHQGTIEISSEEGRGTSVVVTFSAKTDGENQEPERNFQDSSKGL
ncbi:MAG: PAS domain S-box protein [Deltaproteobacteria bacterium]|nr:PAS domain S-box protein [Deltaproteobacteria bacterium]MBW2594667.1 PAS domain S-box protein [Deltaproteobacteria bacterium]MBW2649760.1 PAS domain S-box protein [Deltaproteobacteria bacterium]